MLKGKQKEKKKKTDFFKNVFSPNLIHPYSFLELGKAWRERGYWSMNVEGSERGKLITTLIVDAYILATIIFLKHVEITGKCDPFRHYQLRN